MKSIKSFTKRSLSLILCLAMVMTTMFFFDIGITKTEAAISDPSTPSKGRVALYVPEVIYLYPEATSWRDTTTTPFQYYVQNDPVLSDGFWVGATTNTSLTNQGTIYFSAENGYSNAVLTKRFVDENNTQLADGTEISVNNGVDAESGGLTFRQYNISAGTAPALAKNQTGCFIEWTVTYTDNVGEQKAVTAYTYVYKPYTVPYGGASWSTNSGQNNSARQVAWVSGVHSVTAATGSTSNSNAAIPVYPRFGSSRSLAGFLSKDPYGRADGNITSGTLSKNVVKGRADVTYAPGASDMYTVFSGYENSKYFQDQWCRDDAYGVTDGPQNQDSWSWVTSDDSETGRYDIKSFEHMYETGGEINQTLFHRVSSKGSIYIDTSRYTNLNQVPNLGVCLMVTSCDRGERGSWIVADVTGKDYSAYVDKDGTKYQSGWVVGSGPRSDLYNKALSGAMAYSGGAEDSNMLANNGRATYEGRKYTGPWVSAINTTNTTKTYTLDAYYGNNRSSGGTSPTLYHAMLHMFIDMNAIVSDKSALRNKVYEVLSQFSDLGLTSDFSSKYYDPSSTEWKNFSNAYRKAYMVLTKVDGRMYTDTYSSMAAEVSGVLTELTNTFNALKNAGKQKGTAHQHNIGIVKKPDGTYRMVAIPNAQPHEKTFTFGDSITFSADTFANFTYKGMVKLSSNNITASSLANDSYIIPKDTLPSTSANNKQNYNVTPGTTTSFSGTGTTTRSTEIANFNGSNVVYPSATDSDITYLYYYELNGEVQFGNEFVFDHFDWTTDSNNSITNLNYIDNTVTFKALTANEGYTSKWYTNDQCGYMTLVSGVTYEFSADYKNLSNSVTAVRMMMFPYDSKTATSFVDSEIKSVIVENIAAGASGTVKGYLTMPTGKEYATIRIGIYKDVQGTEVQFSNIAVRNVSSKNDLSTADERITRANPLFKSAASGTSVSGFPTIVLPGYGLAGWSTVRDTSTGYGVAGNKVESTTVASGEYKILHPIWNTNPITYNIKFISEETGESKTQTGLKYDTEYNLDKNTFTRPMYAFDGWLDKATGKTYTDESIVKNLGVAEGDTIELYAQWKPGPELIFGNEFDFDKLIKPKTGMTIDYMANTFEAMVKAKVDDKDPSEYTTDWYYMEFEVGHIYKITYDYDPMGTQSEGQYHIYASDIDPNVSDKAADVVYYGGRGSKRNTSSLTNAAHTFIGTVGEAYDNMPAVVWPEDTDLDGKFYVRIRFDIDNKSTDYASDAKGKYSNIYIYDVTNDETMGVPNPIQITGYPGQVIPVEDFPTVTRRGFTNDGWSTKKNSDGNGNSAHRITESITLPTDGTNKTIYAIWRPNVYTVRFDPNPTEGDTVQVEGTQPDIQMTYGQIASIPALQLTYDGYKFFGWNTNKDGTGKYYRVGDVLEDLTDADGQVVTLYAIWKYDSEVLFGNWLYFDDFYSHVASQENIVIDVETNSLTVTASTGDTGAGSGSSHVESYINDFGPFEDKFEPGKTYAMSYDFEVIEGKAGTQIHLWFGDESRVTETDKTYDFQGTNYFQPGLYEPNSSSTPIGPGDPKTEVLHKFTMPMDRPDLKIRLDVDLAPGCDKAVIKITNVYFYCLNNPAGFVDDICLPHDKDTGEKLVEITGKPRTFVDASQFPVQERTGYEFLGWSMNHIGDGNGDPNSIIKTGVELPSGDERCVLYSVWKAIDYTLKYDPNGGKISSGTGFPSKDLAYDEPFTIPSNNNTYIRDNAIFAGWNTKDDGSGTDYADGAEAKNITAEKGTTYLYAQWKALPEVIYGNLFDFDKYIWEVPGEPSSLFNIDVKVDNVSNTLTLRTNENVGQHADCYTNTYRVEGQEGRINVVPGRTYEFSFNYKNNSNKPAPIRAYLFEYMDLFDTNADKNMYYDVTAAAGASSSEPMKYRVTIGEGCYFLTLRFGVIATDKSNPDVVKNLDVEISDITFRDITDYSDDLAVNEISGITRYSDKLPSVEGKNMFVTNYTFGEEPNPKFDDLRREHYTFLGWSTVLDLETGNGDPDSKFRVTSYQFKEDEDYIQSGNCANVTLYPIWAGNVVLVSFKPELKAHLFDDITKLFEYGKAEPAAEVENPRFTIEYFDGGEFPVVTEYVEAKLVSWDSRDGQFSYTVDPEKGCLIRDPNNFYGHSNVNDENTPTTELVGKWTNGGDFTPAALILKKDSTTNKPTHVLKGWTTIQGGADVEFEVGAPIAASKDMQLHAIWLEIAEQDTSFDNIEETYQEKAEIVTGVTIQANGEAKENVSDKYYIYNREDIDEKLAEYESAKDAFINGTQSAETNNALLDSITGVNNVGPAEDSDKNGLVLNYLEEFEILYADDVDPADMSVDPGKYQVKNMNLNHYSKASLEAAKEALLNTEGFSADQVSREKQTIVNNSVATLAKTYANKEDVQPSTPMYNVYDTVESMQGSELIQSDDLTSVNYVYTGKGNYTYYCYTSSKNPTILITVDDLKTSEDRYCYPTKAETVGTPTAVKGAKTETPVPAVTTDKAAANAYETMYAEYFALNMGVEVDETLGKDYYSQKAVIELKPDFTEVSSDTHNATVSYKFMAYDDAFAGVGGIDKNYADAAKLASGEESGTLNEIPDTGVTGENMFTIIVDYHAGDDFKVEGLDVPTDEWIKQYHLSRTSGGASNWELPMPDDKVYTVNDQTYGQSNYGSFTYTFRMGETTDLANCVLNLDTTTGVDTPETISQVAAIIKDNYNEIIKQEFDGAQEIWQWKTVDGVKKYVCTHEAGTGLGYKAWPNTTWSFNYYPASLVYTYVHLVDRWGNTVDKIIRTPKIDGSATQLHTNSAGTVDVIELGGSGIGTMSLSTETFDIITDENSVFDGETFTTTGNTIKVYTGEANKKYTLEANDIATNKTTADVTTNADGYLTITVEDEAFDKESGMYTFSLNGTEINLYGEVATEPEEPDVPVIPERGVTNVEYTPSVDTRNEFMFTVIGRPDKIQVIEPDGGTRTYDRYHVKVVIVSYDAEGNVVGAMSRDLSYEVWTIEMNVPAEIELTAIARYGREWSKEAPYKYTVILAEPIFDDEVYSMALERTEGKQGKVLATVVTGLDVQGVRFLMDNNTTTTYYLSTEADGKLTYVGNAWINHSGENIIIVKIRVNNAWINAGELNYNAI